MTSSRLPGKVLADLEGAPMIVRQIERLRRANLLDGLVVATSTDPSDDPLVDVLASLPEPVPVIRGSLDDVLDRFVAVIGEFQPAVVVRLTADCPLASPHVIDKVIAAYMESDADYVSNTMQPTYPDGLDVEVVDASVLLEVATESTDAAEHEHVTLGVYRRHDRYQVENVAGTADLSALRWTVDTPEDLAFVRRVYAELYPANPAFDVDDVLALLDREPGLSRTNADAVRNAALDGLDTGAMQHYPTGNQSTR